LPQDFPIPQDRVVINDAVLNLLLTEAQVAERFNVSVPTLRRWRGVTGKGPPFAKLVEGGSVRYPSEELTVWIRSRLANRGRLALPAGRDGSTKGASAQGGHYTEGQ
jgi:predicted DNA-binding transcriptional regulator AlpA